MGEAMSERFGFGKNWSRFLTLMDDHRIDEAVKSLQHKLGVERLDGLIFLDVGSGSGLFSLAAHRLGAIVRSFDYDQDSVNCTQYMKEKYGAANANWTVEQGSVLDVDFIKKFGQVDVLYSWGVLHHTGSMWQALDIVKNCVKKDGKLFISLYNDQGGASRRWTWIKKKYNTSGILVKKLLELYTFFKQWTITMVKDFLKCGNPFRSWIRYGDNNRGMSAYYDLIDWVGGYPFEVASPEVIFNFFKKNGFQLDYLTTLMGGSGCNEYVFTKTT